MSIYEPRAQSRLANLIGDLVAGVWNGSWAHRWWRKFDNMMADSRPDRVIRRYLKARFTDERGRWPNKRPGL